MNYLFNMLGVVITDPDVLGDISESGGGLSDKVKEIFSRLGLYFKYIFDWIGHVFCFIFDRILYFIFQGIVIICNFVEDIFKRLAGIETIYVDGKAYTGGNGNGEDLVYAFITDSNVQNVFFSIVGLSFTLLFVFTIVALIKSEFTIDMRGNAKGPILARSFKSLAYFLAVPVITLLSVVGVNYLTTTVYKMFDVTGNSIASKCFQIGAYNANRARIDDEFIVYLQEGSWCAGGENPFVSLSSDEIADKIDELFINGSETNCTYAEKSYLELCTAAENGEYAHWDADIYQANWIKSKFFNYTDCKMVAFYYDLTEFNFVLAIGSAIVIGWTLLTVCLVLLKRVFELTILFLLSPVPTAIAPLDGGQAEKRWRQEFIKRLFAVIGPIFAYNMYFLLTPIISTITLRDPSASQGIVSKVGGSVYNIINGIFPIFDIFFQLILIYTGLSILKSASAILSQILGVDDLVKSGAENAKAAVAAGTKAFGVASTMALPVAKLAGTAARIAGRTKVGKFIGGKVKGMLPKSKLAKKQQAVDDAEKALENNETYYNNQLEIDNLNQLKDLSGGTLTEANENRLKQLNEEQGKIKQNDANLIAAKQDLEDFQNERSDKRSGLNKSQRARAREIRHENEGLSKNISDIINSDGYIRARDDMSVIKHAKNKKSKKYLNKSLNESKSSKEYIEATNKIASLNSNKQELNDLFRKAEKQHIVRGAFNDEFGAGADKTSLGAMSYNWISKKLNDSDGGFFSNLVSNSMLAGWAQSASKYFGADSSTVKRRFNDHLMDMIGETASGVVKPFWHANTRNNLFFGVPETKGVEAEISASMQKKGWKKFEEDEIAKGQKKKDEEAMMRMLAKQSGMHQYNDILEAISAAQKSGNQQQVNELNVKKATFEKESGLDVLGKQKLYDIAHGKISNSEFENYKTELEGEAAAAAQKEKIASDAANKAAILKAGGNPNNVKLSEASIEQLSKEMANALKNNKDGKSMNVKIDEAIKTEITNATKSISDLAVSISKLADKLPKE